MHSSPEITGSSGMRHILLPEHRIEALDYLKGPVVTLKRGELNLIDGILCRELPTFGLTILQAEFGSLSNITQRLFPCPALRHATRYDGHFSNDVPIFSSPKHHWQSDYLHMDILRSALT
jgi:hypothetical protein